MADESQITFSIELNYISMTEGGFGNKTFVWTNYLPEMTLTITGTSMEHSGAFENIVAGAKPTVVYMGANPKKIKLTGRLYNNLGEFGNYKHLLLGSVLDISSTVGFLEAGKYIVDGYSSNRNGKNKDIIELTVDLTTYYESTAG